MIRMVNGTSSAFKRVDGVQHRREKTLNGCKSFARMRRRCLFTLGYYRLVKLQANIRQVDAAGGCK